jgi:hypothetical protein
LKPFLTLRELILCQWHCTELKSEYLNVFEDEFATALGYETGTWRDFLMNKAGVQNSWSCPFRISLSMVIATTLSRTQQVQNKLSPLKTIFKRVAKRGDSWTGRGCVRDVLSPGEDSKRWDKVQERRFQGLGWGTGERFHGSKKIPRWDEVQERGFVARRKFQGMGWGTGDRFCGWEKISRDGMRYRREVKWLAEDSSGWNEVHERDLVTWRRLRDRTSYRREILWLREDFKW